ncbi:MAG: 2,3-bisphosphoglycerate-independent phosphoglycerate mutase [archaeon]
MEKINKVVLVVLDGCGIYKDYEGNAFSRAKKPVLNRLFKNYPNTILGASEEYVGLPPKQLGSSEVGHSTFGAGCVLESDIVRINKSIGKKEFFKNKVLLSAMNKVKKDNALHIVGLLSDGGVHSHQNHLFAILKVVAQKKLKNVYLHLFADGRDVPPKSITTYIHKLKYTIESLGLMPFVHIASLSGRYYGMDRDNNWDRQKKVYDLLVYGLGNKEDDAISFVRRSYKRQITDEFLEPTLLLKEGTIKNKDTIIFFNFRSDRAREFMNMFINNKFNKFKTKKNLKVNFYSLTEYDSSLSNKVNVILPPIKPKPGIGQVISKKGHKQLRVAETEKFAHVTYFFNLGQEYPNVGEDRILVPSPKVKTFDLEPEMSAEKITTKLLPKLKGDYKFILVNFANGDMVGHTGNIPAAIKGVETIDTCLGKIIKEINFKDTVLLLVADHGNCDEMIYHDGTISTAHSLNKVPFIVVSKNKYELKELKNASIASVGPTILKILDIKIPDYMSKPLIK